MAGKKENNKRGRSFLSDLSKAYQFPYNMYEPLPRPYSVAPTINLVLIGAQYFNNNHLLEDQQC